jgi:hypothetical protein
MLIYGGIFEVCKELNDLHIFDMVNERWMCLFEELNSPGKPSVEGGQGSLKKAQTKLGGDSARNEKKGGFGKT